MGSPPRMRGKLHTVLDALAPIGITPAHAGKTLTLHTRTIGTWDHPRACGENSDYSYPSTREQGSPPRMRGKLRRQL